MKDVNLEGGYCQNMLNTQSYLEEAVPYLSTIREYYQLRLESKLTESQMDRIDTILEDASKNSVLNRWIREIDHSVGYDLGYLGDSTIDSLNNKIALLQEHIFVNKNLRSSSYTNIN